ncbi:hypothetical protein BJY16_006534 [Actinoplanes octamycinicus]|uniref:Uncharacterized protein n=1 Tax=Actinoplanes octamycinicus TaxID=135948 RepID=A0A7W7H323_9ACTN|nr:hypothetical protein [Actinoplanes octamycinicus]MBB4743075.1 hypothetical protein [Actinoplanes octamycinicus]
MAVRTVGTAEDFVAELRRLRVRAGDPSLRQLQRIAGKRIADVPDGHRLDPLSPSTTSEVLGGKRLPRLPRLEFVESYVAACLIADGLDEPAIAAELEVWRQLWCGLATPEQSAEPVPEQPPRPRHRLTLPVAAVVIFAAGVAAGWAIHRPAGPAGPDAEAADTCLAPGAAAPAGQDVLRLPPAGQQGGSWWVNKPAVARLSGDGRRFRADVTSGAARPGDVIIVKSDVALVAGRSYALAFSAAADRATTIRVRVQDSRPPDYQASYDRELSVDQGACRHLYRFVAQHTSAHSELTFQVGGRPHDFQLRVDDPILVETPTGRVSP